MVPHGLRIWLTEAGDIFAWQHDGDGSTAAGGSYEAIADAYGIDKENDMPLQMVEPDSIEMTDGISYHGHNKWQDKDDYDIHEFIINHPKMKWLQRTEGFLIQGLDV